MRPCRIGNGYHPLRRRGQRIQRGKNEIGFCEARPLEPSDVVVEIVPEGGG